MPEVSFESLSASLLRLPGVLQSIPDILRNPADNGTERVQEQDVRGKTNQYLIKFVKPR